MTPLPPLTPLALIAQAVEPIRIATPDAPAGAGLWVWLGIAAAAACATGVAWVVVSRRRARREPLDAAFMSLARALALDPTQREEVLSLAGAAGIPGAVLLVSVTAREEAQRRREERRERTLAGQPLALSA